MTMERVNLNVQLHSPFVLSILMFAHRILEPRFWDRLCSLLKVALGALLKVWTWSWLEHSWRNPSQCVKLMLLTILKILTMYSEEFSLLKNKKLAGVGELATRFDIKIKSFSHEYPIHLEPLEWRSDHGKCYMGWWRHMDSRKCVLWLGQWKYLNFNMQKYKWSFTVNWRDSWTSMWNSSRFEGMSINTWNI